MVKKVPEPRVKYDFGSMELNEVKYFPLSEPLTERLDAEKVLCAAYAYGRRNGMKFCGSTETRRKKQYMAVRRYE